MKDKEKSFLDEKIHSVSARDALVEEDFRKSITKTMVGSLNAIEENLGVLWEGNSDLEKKYRAIYMTIRHKILSIGNDEIRKFEKRLKEDEL